MPPQPSSSSSSPSATGPKGVEFSDHLIVLGASSSSLPPPPPPPLLPKARVFVKRPPIPSSERAASPFVERPVVHPLRPPPPAPSHTPASSSSSGPAHIAPPTETRIPPDEVVLRPPDRRRARFFHTAPQLGELSAVSELRDGDHASDSDSENETIKSTRMSSVHVLDLDEQDLARCTRINTKLNSLPSGGAFSFMNSSEDVDTSLASSSSSCSSDERLRESRKMIRVDGSAKLSTASGVLDSTDEEDEHEFSIEGAESVDEEEAVQVRSLNRTLAKVTLGTEGSTENTALDSTLHEIEASSTPDRERVVKPSGANSANLAVNKAQNCHALREHILRGAGADESEGNAGSSRKRRSLLRITFMRRNSGRNSVRGNGVVVGGVVDDEDYVERSTGSFSAISCFSTRRTSACRSRLRGMTSAKESAEPAAIEDGRRRKKGRSGETCREVVAAPDFEEGTGPRRGMVKNVSLQRDDFIDFTTNGAGRCGTSRGAWLARLVRLGDGCSVSDEESVAGGGEGGRGGRRRRWKLFGRK